MEHKAKALTVKEVMEGRSNAYKFINFYCDCRLKLKDSSSNSKCPVCKGIKLK